MATTVQHVKGSDLPPRVTRPLRILPEKVYTLTIDAQEETPPYTPTRRVTLAQLPSFLSKNGLPVEENRVFAHDIEKAYPKSPLPKSAWE